MKNRNKEAIEAWKQHKGLVENYIANPSSGDRCFNSERVWQRWAFRRYGDHLQGLDWFNVEMWMDGAVTYTLLSSECR